MPNRSAFSLRCPHSHRRAPRRSQTDAGGSRPHCGGSPSATQRMIIDPAAMLTLRLHLMDRQVVQNEVMSERNGRKHLAWSAALTRLLRQLGLEGAADKPP